VDIILQVKIVVGMVKKGGGGASDTDMNKHSKERKPHELAYKKHSHPWFMHLSFLLNKAALPKRTLLCRKCGTHTSPSQKKVHW